MLPEVVVYAGFINSQEPKQKLVGKKLIVHEGFAVINDSGLIDEYGINDIGLIELSSDIEFDDNVKAVQLVQRSNINDSFAGRLSVATGWGQIEEGWASDDLRFVYLTPMKNEECKKYYPFISDSHICTPTGGKSPCNGDSGGPLVTSDTYEQIGITSFGDGCEGEQPAAFARVASYLDWIKSKTGLDV